jgi:hypothetical protein
MFSVKQENQNSFTRIFTRADAPASENSSGSQHKNTRTFPGDGESTSYLKVAMKP